MGLILGWYVTPSKSLIDAGCMYAEVLTHYVTDYGFALLFGIIFQYFSIAPMSGDYGPVTIWRALKADFLSLTSFQVGLYGWMAIYQIAIWNFDLEMDNVVYWWMMQVACTLLRE